MDVELTDGMERGLEKLVNTGRYVSVEEAVKDAVRKHLARIEDNCENSLEPIAVRVRCPECGALELFWKSTPEPYQSDCGYHIDPVEAETEPVYLRSDLKDAIDAGCAEAVNDILDDVDDQQFRKMVMGLANELVWSIEEQLGIRENAQTGGSGD